MKYLEFWPLWLMLAIFMIDASKTAWELLMARGIKFTDERLDLNEVTAIITTLNEIDSIVATINSIRRHFKNIIVVDDGSSDGTAETAEWHFPDIVVIKRKHTSKAQAQHAAVKEAATPYVMFFDADIYLSEDFHSPHIGENTACAFNIVPADNYRRGAWLGNMLIDFQKHEYRKAMDLTRVYHGATATVPCVSGAASLFRTDRILKLAPLHTEIFPGDDLERTAIELLADGKIIFSPTVVKTDVPDSLGALITQRLGKWWPGLWRIMPLFIKLLFKKGIPGRLRMEMSYQVVDIAIDHLKIISLAYLMVVGYWPLVALLYALYLSLETITFWSLRSRASMRNSLATLFLYPFYAVGQLIMRASALWIYIYRRLSGKWRGVNTTIVSLALCLFLTGCNGVAPPRDDHDWRVMPRYEVIDDSNERSLDGPGAYVSYKNTYLDLSVVGRGDNKQERYLAGTYFESLDWILNPTLYLIRTPDEEVLIPKIMAERGLGGGVVGRLGIQYISEGGRNLFLPQLGADYYYNGDNFFSLDWYKVYGNDRTVDESRLKHRWYIEDGQVDAGATMNEDGNVGWFVSGRRHNLFIGYYHWQNFENYDYDRDQFQLGLMFDF
ncbi:MAG: glycosyltransferase [bacterium]|nr:glycosyltransferase [bacterium]